MLAAQGFADARPAGRVDRRHVRRALGRVGLLQMDSVNAFTRSHEVPLFSRLGPYPRPLLHELAAPGGALFEYWGHEASLLPVAWQPLVRWRMARAARGETWGRVARLAEEQPQLVADVLAEVVARGPLSAGEVSGQAVRQGPWWGWSDTKVALEWLFWTGQVAATRRPSFERVYDAPERILPVEVLAAPTPPEDEAHRRLLLHAVDALGVGTAADLADWFRLRTAEARTRLEELAEGGRVERVQVRGWRQPAYARTDLAVPRRVRGTTLLSPFDSLVFERERTERVFGFRYRLEFYVPAPRRVWGYYVMPVLHDGHLRARVDVRSDRRAGALVVVGAWSEAGDGGTGSPGLVDGLAGALADAGSWLGLAHVAVGAQGDLAEPLGRIFAERLAEERSGGDLITQSG